MEHILKLEEKFWLEIESGNKDVEIRKLNKSHIKSGDIICYVDLESTKVLGRVYVMSSTMMAKTSVLQYDALTKETGHFIRENYQKEETLVFIVISPLESLKVQIGLFCHLLMESDDKIDDVIKVITESLDDDEIEVLTERLEDIF